MFHRGLPDPRFAAAMRPGAAPRRSGNHDWKPCDRASGKSVADGDSFTLTSVDTATLTRPYGPPPAGRTADPSTLGNAATGRSPRVRGSARVRAPGQGKIESAGHAPLVAQGGDLGCCGTRARAIHIDVVEHLEGLPLDETHTTVCRDEIGARDTAGHEIRHFRGEPANNVARGCPGHRAASGVLRHKGLFNGRVGLRPVLGWIASKGPRTSS